MPTTPTQIRLTDDDKDKLESIRRWAGLPSLAAAIRFSAGYTHRHAIGAGPGKPAKSPKIREKTP